jgi:PKD repeat protein
MSQFKLVISVLLLFFCIGNANCQLKASFTATKYEGCSPLLDTFINTTTGASAAATYTWNFGNGNSSSIKDSVEAEYINQQTYTVILTVTDGGVTSIDSVHITVDQNPVPSFTVSDSVGCTPFSVTFTSTSIAGSGNISNYYWEFSNGVTDSTSSPTVSNTFIGVGRYPVKLIVATTTGCISASATNYINALQTPTAAYTRNKNYLCILDDSVVFTNQSTNLLQPTYLWDFGDGSTSTAMSPTHPYIAKGFFYDSLIVTNANGCSDTAFYPSPIYLSSFSSSFSTNVICADAQSSFTNTSVPTPNSSIWYFGSQPNGVAGINVTYKFDSTGVYNVELINTFGACYDTVNKSVTVLPPVSLGGFSIVTAPLCGGKTLLELNDTSSGSIAWTWSVKGISGTINTDTAQYELPDNSNYIISLTATKSSGCNATATDTVQLKSTQVTIVTTTNNNISDTSGCAGLVVNFSATPANGIKSYLWNLGDGTTSTDSTVTHTYNSVGVYPIQLIYTTLDGCTDTAYSEIHTFSKPVPIFYTPDTLNCGNKAYFYNTTKTPTTAWTWYIEFINDSLASSAENPDLKFPDTGYYTIKFIAYNNACYDSVTYFNYIHILAPFLHTDTVKYTCNGLRDTAFFYTSSYYVQSQLTLNFGDSSANAVFDTSVHVITHVYDSTGTYRSILSGTNFNSGCTTRDTEWVHILYKQYPILSANVSSVCENDSIKVKIDTSTLARNPGSSDSNYYSIFMWQYGDTSTVFSGVLDQQRDWYYSFLGYLKGLTPGQTQLRAITKSEFFGCLDTTNYINLQVKGPIVGYYISNPKNCFRQPLSFVDTSKPTFNIPIVQWIWGFGDNTYDTTNTGGIVLHNYASPGKYATFLKVTDSAGCYAETSLQDTAKPSGPKANFTWTPTHIVAGTTAKFINTSNTYEDTVVIYQWYFTSDTLKVTTKNATNTYPNPVIDTVTLIATAPADGCSDTIVQIIPIKEVFALFTYTVDYINNNNCPPLIAYFTSESINADQLSWDFGDGTPGTGLIPATDSLKSHTYNLPGIYVVTLYAYKNGALFDSSSRTISVQGAYAKVKASITEGCVPTTVTFTSSQTNTTSFEWDFGDGNIVNGTDTVQSHTYTVPKLYTPQVILIDTNGCKSAFSSPKPILVDSLSASFTTNLNPICDSATVIFIPKVWSYSGNVLDSPVYYHWYFGTGKTKDTSNLDTASHYYHLGTYPISQTVRTVAGCIITNYDTIAVVRSARATINGPIKVCDSLPISFSGSIKTNDSIGWKWYFGNGDTSILQKPLPVYFTTPKDSITTDTILLVSTFNNCLDSTPAYITVLPRPVVNLTPLVPLICEGKSTQLFAFDGKVGGYKWSSVPVSKILGNDSTVTVSPDTATTYYVTITNKYGCVNTDSTDLDVQQYLTLVYPKDTFVCKGLSVVLPISGATNYAWLADSATLSNTVSNPSDPTAKPADSVTYYKFVASDQYGCFHDTESIKVLVDTFPTLSTLTPVTVLTGDSVLLQTYGSADVVSYLWSPTTYLGCSDCSSTFCAPRSDIVYTVSATNQWGCTVTAGLTVNIVCSQSVYLPNAFTPGGKNPIFYPIGKGIRSIKYLRIFNRDGNLLFEREEAQVNDRTAGWDGTYNGKLQAAGTYVYTAQAQCDTGDIIPLKGTLVLIR